MKKLLILISIVAASMFSTARAAVGDETTIVDQTLKGKPTLEDKASSYSWGSDVQGMLTDTGLAMTNGNSTGGNFTNRDFLTFTNVVGNATHELNISYDVAHGADKGQAVTYYTINYFNADGNFVFGIQEGSGDWDFPADIITANSEGDPTTTALPAAHIKKNSTTTPVNLTIKFSGNQAIIDIDGSSYTAYTSSEGIKNIKLTVDGGQDFSRYMSIEKFTVKTTEVEAAKFADYTLKYVVGSETIKEETKSGEVGSAISLNSTDTADFDEGDIKYIFVSDDASGKTVAEDGSTVITLTYREAATYNYTVMSNVPTTIKTGTCLEGEKVSLAYSRYILAEDGTVWMKDATNKEYNHSFTPNTDNFVETISYTKIENTNGIFFAEAEKMEGMTEVTSGNANVRCSNSAGGYATEEGAFEIITLQPGTYKIEIGVWGGATKTFEVKAGEDVILTANTTGSWVNSISEEFTLNTETTLTFEGADNSHPIDYFLITGSEASVTDQPYKIQYVEDNKVIKEIDGGFTEVGSTVTLTEDQLKDFITEDGTKYIYVSNDADKQLIAADGSTVITITVRKAAEYHYTIKNNVNKDVVEDVVQEGESVTVPISKYILTEDGTVWTKAANSSNPWYGASITPDKDGYTYTLEYKEAGMTDGIYFVEAENIEAIAQNKVTGSNADIRCSNQAGSYSSEAVDVFILDPGTYKVTAGIWGNRGTEFIFNAGEIEVLKGMSSGSHHEESSEDFTLNETTVLTFKGGTSQRPLDYILITGKVKQETENNYVLEYKVGEDVIKETVKLGTIGEAITISEEEMADFYSDDKSIKYIYVSNNAEGKTVTTGEPIVITLTYKEAAKYNYTVSNNVNDVVVSGTCFEGESAVVPFSKYIIKEDGNVWQMAANSTNPHYGVNVTPDKDEYEVELSYKATDMTNGIYFVEAENIMTLTNRSEKNIDIRCSNMAGGYSDVPVKVCTLKAGTYKIELGTMGNRTFTINVGEDKVAEITPASSNSYEVNSTEEFTVLDEADLTISGGASDKPLDYILITGTVGIPVTGISISKTDATMTMGENLDLVATVTPANATDATVTWTSDNKEVATVANGKVTALKPGKVNITAACGDFKAVCVIKIYPALGDATMDGNIDITDAVDITNYVVGKKEVATADMEYYKKAANANEDADGNITFADASAAVKIALTQAPAESTQSRISASYAEESADALVVGRASASSYGTTVPVTLDNSEAYVALQADIILPEGMNVEVKAGGRTAESHTMMTNRFADNHIRVAFFNLGNTAFADSDAPMFEITTDSYISASDVVISYIIASDSDANRYVLSARSAEATAVEAIGFDATAPIKVFDLNGIYVSDSMTGLQQGTYIVRQGDIAKKVRIR